MQILEHGQAQERQTLQAVQHGPGGLAVGGLYADGDIFIRQAQQQRHGAGNGGVVRWLLGRGRQRPGKFHKLAQSREHRPQSQFQQGQAQFFGQGGVIANQRSGRVQPEYSLRGEFQPPHRAVRRHIQGAGRGKRRLPGVGGQGAFRAVQVERGGQPSGAQGV